MNVLWEGSVSVLVIVIIDAMGGGRGVEHGVEVE